MGVTAPRAWGWFALSPAGSPGSGPSGWLNPSFPPSQGPGHLTAHGPGCPHQLAAQQWCQLCGCRPAERFQLQGSHTGLPSRHPHCQPVGLQEHHRETAGGWGHGSGGGRVPEEHPFLCCPRPPRTAHCRENPGAASGVGAHAGSGHCTVLAAPVHSGRAPLSRVSLTCDYPHCGRQAQRGQGVGPRSQS